MGGGCIMLFLTIITDQNVKDQLESLYVMYKRDLYVTAFSILKDQSTAEDIVHDAILKAACNLEKFSEIKCNKTRVYLVIIVKNLCIDYLRRNKKVMPFDYELLKNTLLDHDDLLEEQMIKMDITREMEAYLNELNPSYAQVIMLRFYHGLTVLEIAKILEITEGNVRVRLNRALNAMKVLINEGGASDEIDIAK